MHTANLGRGSVSRPAADAETLVRALHPLWDAMEDVGGLVDLWAGGEFCHLFPTMLAVIGREAH